MGFWVVAALLILIIVSENGINKILGVKKEKISETPGKRIDRWGRGIILIVCISTLPFVITRETNVMKWYWIFYFVLLFGFQAILEWKFLKDSKRFLLHLFISYYAY
ncbi:DUF4181 domain-containing protein [Lederbergia lenta]|uniref:Uncharacterized protein n=1 Tax=Lederbergia lenta TaxID=1467 RepID=A0A2X4W9Y4_LEDLE|nr:DUF4181 domain-containing protein [Lederbergia lenta]MCM3109806.1 DUF4181 domain-containing protein [Lederbergia lenta]MEC2324444.1 DUF4181 domain-containing protein [Lederbergia lenta]SQI59833.1 Uncharacterised protein [Lederbergia lenta]